MKIINDLDKFTLEHIIRPYANQIQEWDLKPYEHITKMILKPDDVIKFSKLHPSWWKLVSNRINAIGFKKGKWHINHTLLDYLNIK